MSLFSVVTLVAFSMHQTKALVSMETASWYDKKGELTFSDIIAIVRRSIWSNKYFSKSETRLYEKSPRRIPAAQTAGPMYEVLIYDNNQTQSGV